MELQKALSKNIMKVVNGKKRERCLNETIMIIKAHNGVITTVQLANALGITDRAAYERLRNAVKEGLIRSKVISFGRYGRRRYWHICDDEEVKKYINDRQRERDERYS